MDDLFIEFCDFKEVPSGGQLSFAKNFRAAFGADSAYVGLAGESEVGIGSWVANSGAGEGRFFAVASRKAFQSRRLVPARLRAVCYFARYAFQLRKEVWGRVFVQSPEALLCALLLRRHRIEYRFAGVNNPAQFSRYPIVRKLASIFWGVFCCGLRRVSRIFVTAGDSEIALLRTELSSRGVAVPLEFLPTLVDDTVFAFDREILRDSLRAIYAGRLNRGKRCDVLIRAFARVCSIHPNAHLSIVGDGEEASELKALCETLGLERNVKLLGARPQEDVAREIRSSNLFVLASEREGWPTCLVEAACIGRFIVSTPVSGAREICGDQGVRGLVIPDYSEETLAAAIIDSWALVSEGLWSPSPDRRFVASSLKTRLAARG